VRHFIKEHCRWSIWMLNLAQSLQQMGVELDAGTILDAGLVQKLIQFL
jgi:hypothetical protein